MAKTKDHLLSLITGCCGDGGADKGGGLWEGGGGLTTLIEGNLAAFDFCSSAAGLLEAVATGAGLMPDVVGAGGFLESTWFLSIVGFLEGPAASISLKR